MKTEIAPIAEIAAAVSTADATETHPGLIRINEILVPVDMSNLSFKALEYAISFAKAHRARLTLLHVVEPAAVATELGPAPCPTSDDMAALEKELREIRKTRIPRDVAVDVAVRCDTAAEAILDAASEFEPDLIILATHGRTGLSHLFMGSTTEKVVRTASCPVLVVRERERDFV